MAALLGSRGERGGRRRRGEEESGGSGSYTRLARVPRVWQLSPASVPTLGHVERISTDVEGERAGAHVPPPWRGGGGIWGRQGARPLLGLGRRGGSRLGLGCCAGRVGWRAGQLGLAAAQGWKGGRWAGAASWARARRRAAGVGEADWARGQGGELKRRE